MPPINPEPGSETSGSETKRRLRSPSGFGAGVVATLHPGVLDALLGNRSDFRFGQLRRRRTKFHDALSRRHRSVKRNAIPRRLIVARTRIIGVGRPPLLRIAAPVALCALVRPGCHRLAAADARWHVCGWLPDGSTVPPVLATGTEKGRNTRCAAALLVGHAI